MMRSRRGRRRCRPGEPADEVQVGEAGSHGVGVVVAVSVRLTRGLGKFAERDLPDYSGRDWNERAFTIGIGGCVVSYRRCAVTQPCYWR
jgi:hypothetical protein